MRYSTALTILILSLSLLLIASCRNREHNQEEAQIINDSIPPLGFWEEDYHIAEGTVKNGDTFSGLMGRLGMETSRAIALANACDSCFDVRKLRAGNSIKAYSDTVSGRLEYAVYSVDKTHQVIFSCGDSLGVWTYTKPIETHRKYTDVTISSSLWNDMSASGSSPLLILSLSDVYAWTVDFFGLQKNDRFRVIYQEKSCEGALIGIDTIYFAAFSRDGKDLYAIMYDQGDGGNIYWDEKGGSMRRAFLKAPLEFKRISSGFSYKRKHPVTGQIKPHTAVDYAAPTGTPVVSIGDGTVISVGWAGGGGNTVKIRHNSEYVTSYMHLSKYASGIKNGVRVSQGQVIGYVGATGTATGPHLDFRVYKNGTAINPLTMESPSAEPIKEENLAALDSVFVIYKAELDSLTALGDNAQSNDVL